MNFPDFVVSYKELLLLENTIVLEKNLAYLSLYIRISMKKKSSNVSLVPCNGVLIVQNVLRTILLKLDRQGRTYPEVSIEIVFF